MTHDTDLSTDSRGSILIVGLCMGIIMVLASLHVIGVTEAILTRAIGQNEADAMALEGAIWHAQGMNTITIINLIMAAVMALFIAIRVAEIALAVAIVIASLAVVSLMVLEFFTGGASSAALAVAQQALRMFIRAEQQVVKLEQRVSNPIFQTLTWAANTERLVAAAYPYVSFARPVTRSANIEGTALATSLFPSAFENIFSKAPNVPIAKGKDGKSVLLFKNDFCDSKLSKKEQEKCRGFEVESSFPARMGTLPQPTLVKYYIKQLDKKMGGRGVAPLIGDVISGGVGSLPVQEEDFYQVCGRGAEFMSTIFTRVFKGPLGLDDATAQALGDIIAVSAGSLAKVACTPLPTVTKNLKAQAAKAILLACTEEKVAFEAAEQAKKDKDSKYKKQDFDLDKCKDGKKGKGGSGNRDPVDVESIKIARLWGLTADPANSPFLHVWAAAPIDSRFNVEAADAVGEFRHVCDGKQLDAARRGCAENSLFSPGWYGKLVPVRSFGDEMAANFGEIMSGWISRAIGKAITGLVDRLLKDVKFKSVPGPSGYAETVMRQIGGQYRSLAIGSKAANGWWNRRLLSGEITKALGVNNWNIMTDPAYPEHLH
ncbi:MAG: hypothetical protein RL701_5803 [Pseudomonadota bacterium]|jgi:hypothetical protein